MAQLRQYNPFYVTRLDERSMAPLGPPPIAETLPSPPRPVEDDRLGPTREEPVSAPPGYTNPPVESSAPLPVPRIPVPQSFSLGMTMMRPPPPVPKIPVPELPPVEQVRENARHARLARMAMIYGSQDQARWGQRELGTLAQQEQINARQAQTINDGRDHQNAAWQLLSDQDRRRLQAQQNALTYRQQLAIRTGNTAAAEQLAQQQNKLQEHAQKKLTEEKIKRYYPAVESNAQAQTFLANLSRVRGIVAQRDSFLSRGILGQNINTFMRALGDADANLLEMFTSAAQLRQVAQFKGQTSNLELNFSGMTLPNTGSAREVWEAYLNDIEQQTMGILNDNNRLISDVRAIDGSSEPAQVQETSTTAPGGCDAHAQRSAR
ncbi:MAG: hypothetical protein HC923_00200, partial [Myxococcales bacterium]|nr:hypothetical protein [Myxococcales bacterium]